jgi:CubicO group peptidase (beta-lactamase class C family)
VAEVFPDIDCAPEFKAATLRQLLSHTAGVQPYTLIDGPTGQRMWDYPGGPVQQRHAFMLDVLNQPSLFAPGEGFRYSNAGYGVAAHMAEAASGVPWEDLVARVYERLGMSTAGIGLPSALSEAEPVGHTGAGPEFRPTTGGVPNLSPIWPAGNAHSDIEDLATFAAAHLAGLRGQDGMLAPGTVAAMHEPAPGTDAGTGWVGYAMGWAIEQWPREGVISHAHNGSAGTYYATMRIFPDQDMAIVTLMNVGMPGDMLAPKVERAIYERFGR